VYCICDCNQMHTNATRPGKSLLFCIWLMFDWFLEQGGLQDQDVREQREGASSEEAQDFALREQKQFYFKGWTKCTKSSSTSTRTLDAQTRRNFISRTAKS
jgi:hypothetical protein